MTRLAVACFEIGASSPDAGLSCELTKVLLWAPAAGSKRLPIPEPHQEDPAVAAVDGSFRCQTMPEVGTGRGGEGFIRRGKLKFPILSGICDSILSLNI